MSDEEHRPLDQSDREAEPGSSRAVGARPDILPRVPNRLGPWLLAAAVIVVFTVIATAPGSTSSATGGDPKATPLAIATVAPATMNPTPSSSSIASTSPAGTLTSSPTWAVDLLGQLECEGPPANIGDEVGSVYGEGLSPKSPEAAMDVFTTTTMYTSFPAGGYDPTHLDKHWAQFAHLVDGEQKALVVLRDEGPDIDAGIWSLAGLRACDPSEFAPESGFTGALLTVWLDAEGIRVPTTTIGEFQGPAHCAWDTATFLYLDGALYLRDPEGILAHDLVVPFELDVKLPEDARSTGYHEAGRTIWLDDDPRSIYVVIADRVERWPRAAEEIGCM